jgi:hypothetical protein
VSRRFPPRLAAVSFAVSPLQQGVGTRLAYASIACAVLWAAVAWALS